MLKGLLDIRQDPYIILDVHGVGYKILASNEVLSHLPVLGNEVKVYTYTLVREDMLELYGFTDPADLRLFELLISVSGVGPKSAIGVFSVGKRGEIVSAILKNDVTFFSQVPRLGKKNAQKIIIELKGKLGSGEDLDLSVGDGIATDDLSLALKNFGYSQQEISQAVQAVSGEGESTAEKLRLALKYLGK
ncbi:Holliday junction branch migration protein RuvA [soil metagenome]